MRILIIHSESSYFSGAERMLGYFLEGTARTGLEIAVAVVPESRMAALLPEHVRPVWISDNQRFSAIALCRQVRMLCQHGSQFPFDLVHGWAARDWELASLVGKLTRRPAIGTLHDHPTATYISPKRQCLMRWCAAFGLAKVTCVSAAVRDACAAVGYQLGKLTVIHNGLPPTTFPPSVRSGTAHRVGFLGAFSEGKGLRGLFEIADQIKITAHSAWELHIAGETQDGAGRQLVGELRARYGAKTWWPRVHWHGWVRQPQEFLGRLDLLIVPSLEFDSLPTVLLEAGQIGVPVLAARVGGVAEVIRDGDNGWLFDVGDWLGAANTVNRLFVCNQALQTAGRRAAKNIHRSFSSADMIQKYCHLYSTLLTND